MDTIFETYLHQYIEGRLPEGEFDAFDKLVEETPGWNWDRVEELRRLHLIEQYVEDKLTGEEREEVRQKIAEEESWQALYDQYRNVRQALAIDRRKRRLDRIKAIVHNEDNGNKKTKPFWPWATPLLLILAIALGIIYVPGLPSNERKITPDDQQSEEPVLTPFPTGQSTPEQEREPEERPEKRSEESSVDPSPGQPPAQSDLPPIALNLLREQSAPGSRPDLSFTKSAPLPDSLTTRSLQGYQQGQFAQIIQLLSPVQQALIEREDTQMLLALGLAYFYREDYRSANELFTTLLSLPNSLAHDEARWFLALGFLHRRDTAAARKALADIVGRSSHAHYYEAEKLLQALEN